jgi:YfiH family protein
VYSWRASVGPVDLAFTDRYGGVSAAPYDELNLALEENLDAVAYALARGGEPSGGNPFELPPGTPLPTVVRMRQVHGNDVQVVDQAWLDARPADLPRADGLVSDVPGVALVVRVADCVPVLLADPARGVIGAVHAGRPGLVAGVVPATVSAMRELGAEDLVAWVGPHICGRCYEVPDTMRADVAAVVPEAFAETSWGTPAVDVGAGVVAQLRTAGAEVLDAATCTREDERLFSHRRHESGRLAGLVWVRP